MLSALGTACIWNSTPLLEFIENLVAPAVSSLIAKLPLAFFTDQSGLLLLSVKDSLGWLLVIVISPEPKVPVIVVTPAMLTLSKFVWPSTSRSAFISTPLDKFSNLTKVCPTRNLLSVSEPALKLIELLENLK